MMLNMLLETTVTIGGENVTYLDIQEALLYALLGFAITFVGIVVLVFLLWCIGKVMAAFRSKSSRKQKQTEQPEVLPSEEDVSPQVNAAIVAAIAAYYAGENTECEFKVRRIRRL